MKRNKYNVGKIRKTLGVPVTNECYIETAKHVNKIIYIICILLLADT